MSGMKVFTDTESQFQSRVFQPTASNLRMEPRQTVATNLYVTARNSTSASLLNATVRQTEAANLYANVRNSTSASLLNATVKQTEAANLQTTLGNRAILDTTASLGVTSSTTYAYGAVQNVITLSKFSFIIKGGTAAANVKLQLSPIGGTVAANWIDDDTVVRTLAANAITILSSTRFSKFMRIGAKQSGTDSATLALYYQGQV